jgi:hypothetical protein
MRGHRSVAVFVLIGVLLVAAAAAPAHAISRFRKYKGETSAGLRVSFVVQKSDAGRFLKGFDIRTTMTCDDETTQDWVIGFGFASRQVPIVDRAFSFDDVDPFMAIHLEGELGRLQGQGTVSIAVAALDASEQAQLCTSGDLTWTAEFVGWVSHVRLADRGTTARIEPRGERALVRAG